MKLIQEQLKIIREEGYKCMLDKSRWQPYSDAVEVFDVQENADLCPATTLLLHYYHKNMMQDIMIKIIYGKPLP
tara:strand:- start:9 stop:230 length:222 start_codon:yes stop_codon:yes gene_type:complete